MVRRYQNPRPYWPWMCTMAMKKLYKFPPHGTWIWYWVCTMVTKKISKFPPPPNLKLTLSVYNRVFAFFNFDMACKCQPRPVALGDRIDTFCCFLHDMSFSCMDFQNPSREFHDLISGFQNPSSEFHNLVLEFHNPPGRVSQYDFPVSQCKFHNTTCKFQNTTSKCHNPSFRIHSPHFAIRSPSFTIRRWPVHQGFSSRFPLNFLMVPCIFFRFPFSACSKFLQGSFRFSFHVSCAFVSRCLDAFLLQFLCGFLLVFLHGFF